MPKQVLPVVIVFVALAGVLTMSAALVLGGRGGGVSPVIGGGGPPSDMVVPAFELTDQDAAPLDQSVLEGRYTVVDFFFTSCPTWCPLMTAAMQHVQDSTPGTDLRFLSISIDGNVDTPEQLRSYIGQYAVDGRRWTFATGSPADVAALVTRGLGFDLSLDPSMVITKADGSTGPMINHPTRLLLVGPDRQVLGLYRHDDPGDLELLISDALRLAGG
ncbi:MAG: SCO family protein [Planctomycetota bacterium]